MTTDTLPGPTPVRRPRPASLIRGRDGDAVWVRPSLLALLAATAVLYLWGLADSGWANSFYAAAVQAGTHSWKAAFFGSSDASNFITVDKPPVSLWVMELSARIFGLSSWSLLVPQALEGVAAVGLLYATVRRWFGPAAALLAGAALAVTPVAALMFRFDNPDALLTLLLVAAAYAAVRAVERGSGRWLELAAILVGTGFLTKMLQAFLVVPALALAYLVAAPNPLRTRLLRVAGAAVALVVASGWWVAIVQLTPASDRPYIGGSQDNSLVNLIFGYNGFGRLTGAESGSVGGGGGAGGQWGPTGITRLFNSSFGGQISWLIPAALVAIAALLVIGRRAPRTDRTRAAVIVWGGWLLVTGLVFSLAQGIIHPYYSVALAPPVAALAGIGAVYLWQRRADTAARLALAAGLAATAAWSWELLGRTPSFHPALRPAILVGGAVAVAGIAAGPRLGRNAARVAAVAGVAVALAGPAAYTLDTVTTAHTGAIPSAGPAVAGAGFGPGAGGGGLRRPAGAAGGGPGGAAGAPQGGGTIPRAGGTAGAPSFGGGQTAAPVRTSGATGPGAIGAILGSSTPSAQLVKLLKSGSGYRWAAASVGSNAAAGYQLASGEAVMAIGGFNGTDPAPTPAQFEAYVRRGEIHWFIAGGSGGGGTGSDAAAITAWVKQHYTSRTVSGVTLYDLTSPRS
ncbi:MAG TPA: glycosyltransferase family 39 protein [Gaiellales bacterium]